MVQEIKFNQKKLSLYCAIGSQLLCINHYFFNGLDKD